MFPIERREKIIENLEKNGSITVEALAQKLEVTPTTIRRDLKYLEDNDRITRTFGGAVVKEGLVEEIAVSQKASAYQAEKKRIAREAEKLVEDGQTIVLDAGTTNMELALLLARGTKQISSLLPGCWMRPLWTSTARAVMSRRMWGYASADTLKPFLKASTQTSPFWGPALWMWKKA